MAVGIGSLRDLLGLFTQLRTHSVTYLFDTEGRAKRITGMSIKLSSAYDSTLMIAPACSVSSDVIINTSTFKSSVLRTLR